MNDPKIDDGASPANQEWTDQGHEPGPDVTDDELANVEEWVEHRRLVAELDPAGQLEANKQVYATILGLEGES